MKWTCRRCALQRDDRRGSNCNGVKGQAHDWLKTGHYLFELSQHIWEKWLETNDGINYANEKERVEKDYQLATDIINDSDVVINKNRYSNTEDFYKEKRIYFVIGITLPLVVCAFLFKSYILGIFIPLIAGVTWLAFFIKEKISHKKWKEFWDKEYELKRPYRDIYDKENQIIEEKTMKHMKKFMQTFDRIGKLNDNELSFILKKIYETITK